jgi:hypothetical protein
MNAKATGAPSAKSAVTPPISRRSASVQCMS